MRFWEDLERYGDRVALVAQDGSAVTYSALAALADHCAPDPNELTLLEVDYSIAAIAVYLGALRHKAPIILINSGDEAAVARIIETFGPALRWSPKGGLEWIATQGPVTHPDLALLLSTSGTTGATKLVRLSAVAVDANARSIVEYLGLEPADRAITTLPLGYSYGLSVLNSHLLAGASVVLNETSVIDPAFREAVERHAVTNIAGVPYTYELLERTGFFHHMPGSIRAMTQAGGRLAPDRVKAIGELARRNGWRFFVMYGQTEATARMAYLPPDRTLDHPDCIGRAIPGGRFELVDAITGKTTPEEGELVYVGRNVMMGYAETALDLSRPDEIDRLATGDLAERVGDLFRIVGRKSRFLKVYGLRIALDEVEREAARQGWTLIATGTDDQLVLCSEGQEAEATVGFFADRYGLPASSISAFHVDQIPRLASGKVDYQSIISAVPVESTAANSDGNRSAIETLFRKQFPDKEIRPEMSFLSLDGDSLNYVAVSVGIEQAIGHVPSGWEHKTIGELETLEKAIDRCNTRRGAFAWLETGIVLRAIAPITVVLFHYQFRMVAGGAAVLFVVSGQNLARFSIPEILRGRPWSVLSSFFTNVLIPYWIIVGGWELVHLRPSFWELSLLNNWVHQPAVTPFWTWFIQVLIQLVLVLVAIFSIPAYRRLYARNPFVASITLMCVGATGALLEHLSFGVHDVMLPNFWLITFGIAIACATRVSHRVLLMALLVVVGILIRDSDGRAAYLLAAISLLIWMPTLPVPIFLRKPIGLIASSSLFIYMLHHAIPARISLTRHWPVDVMRTAVAVAFGVSAWSIWQWTIQRFGRRRGKAGIPSSAVQRLS